MTTSRSSGLFLCLLAAACGSSGPDYPDANSDLGRIARMGDFQHISAELKRYAEARLDRPAELRTAFLRADFVPSTYRDEHGVECQSFHRESRDVFPIVMLVNICGRDVFANAGQTAP